MREAGGESGYWCFCDGVDTQPKKRVREKKRVMEIGTWRDGERERVREREESELQH